MADRKEWKEQLLSKLLDQYEKSVTYELYPLSRTFFIFSIRFFGHPKIRVSCLLDTAF